MSNYKPNLKGDRAKGNPSSLQQRQAKFDQDVYEEQNYDGALDNSLIQNRNQNQRQAQDQAHAQVQEQSAKQAKPHNVDPYRQQLNQIENELEKQKPLTMPRTIPKQEPTQIQQQPQNSMQQDKANKNSFALSEEQTNPSFVKSSIISQNQQPQVKEKIKNQREDSKVSEMFNRKQVSMSQALLRASVNTEREILEKEEELKDQKGKDTQSIEEGNLMGKYNDMEAKFPQQTLRYGDVITINFDKSQKILHTNKIFFYRGIVYCNGITKKNLDIVSRNFEHKPEAFCNFKSCLFQIESCSSYEMNHKMHQLRLEKMKIEEDQESQEPNKQANAQHPNENDNDNKKKSLKKRIKDQNQRINYLMEDYERENRDNEYLNTQLKGTKVLYGDMVLLKHVESSLYLSLDQNEPAEENGCMAAKLMQLNEYSTLSIVPSDRLRQNGQIIQYQDSFLIRNYIEPAANKQAQFLHASLFKLEKKMVQAVLEVNVSSDVSVFKARLFQPFDYFGKTEERGENIISGNVIKFFHKQTNGYLSVQVPDITKSKDLQYPERTVKEIQQFEAAEKVIKKAYNTLNPKTTDEDQANIVDGQNPGAAAAGVQEESKSALAVIEKPDLSLDKVPSSKKRPSPEIENEPKKNEEITEEKVTIEIDSQDSNKARYFWEIQKLKPFVIKHLQQGDIYRIKHVQTGLYLCILDKEDASAKMDEDGKPLIMVEDGKEEDSGERGNFELSIKPLADTQNFLFFIQKDSKMEDSDVRDDKKKKKENIKDRNLIIIESFFKRGAKIQSIQQNQEEEHKKRKEVKSIFKTNEQLQQQSFEEVKCLDDNKESHSRMVFTIQKAIQSQSELVQIALNQCNSAKKFFKKLNKFAEKKEENKEPTYDQKKAREKEGDLDKLATSFKENLIDLRHTLKSRSDDNLEEYRLFQNYLAEQGALDVYIKLLELIILRTTPLEQRQQYSRNKRYFEYYLKNKNKFVDGLAEDIKPYMDYLEKSEAPNSKGEVGEPAQANDNRKTVMQSQLTLGGPLALQEQEETMHDLIKRLVIQQSMIPAEILSVVLLAIKNNPKVDSILDKYPEIMFTQLLGQDIKKAKKIFKVSYKLSRLGNNKDDYQSCKEAIDKQINNQRSLGRWIDLIFDPNSNQDSSNLKQQIIFFKVISLICQDENGNGIYENQNFVYEKLFKNPNRLRTIYFGLLKDTEGVPYIQFHLRGDKPNEQSEDLTDFHNQNQVLHSVNIQAKDNYYDHKRIYEDKKSPQYNLLQIFQKQSMSNFAKYICAYLDTLITCLQNGQKQVQLYPEQIGLHGKFALKVIDYLTRNPTGTSGESKLISILLKFLTYMYINNDPAYGILGLKNRCYYWESIDPKRMQHKYLQILDKDKDKIKAELTKQEKDSMSQDEQEKYYKNLSLEQNRKTEKEYVYKYLPKAIQKILKVHEGIDYSYINTQANAEQKMEENQIKSDLNSIIAALQASLEVILCEKSNPALTYRIIYAAAIVFSQFSNKKEKNKNGKNDFQEDIEKSDEKDKNSILKKHYLYLLISSAKDTDSKYKELIEELYVILLKNLIVISKKRIDDQIMISLKSYKRRVTEKNYDFFGELDQAKRGRKIMVSNYDPFAKSLAHLFNIQATGEAVIDRQFVNGIEDPDIKSQCIEVNDMFHGGKNGIKIQFNIKEQLLFLIFDKKLKASTKSLAFEVLMLNFEMVNTLKTEMNKVYIITEEIQDEYKSMQELRYKISSIVSDIIVASYRSLEQQGIQISDKKKEIVKQQSKKLTDECKGYINDLQKKLKPGDSQYRQNQRLLMYLEMPRLLIDCIMKNVNYDPDLHEDLFKVITEFLYSYSYKNEENSQSLTSQLDYLSSLQQISISNEKLITQIVKQLKSQEKETQLIDHIMVQISTILPSNQISEENQSLENIPTLLKSLNSLALNSVFNKGNIFNKILKMEIFKYVYFQTYKKNQSNNSNPDDNKGSQPQKIQECIQNYKNFFKTCFDKEYVEERSSQNEYKLKISLEKFKNDADYKKLMESRYEYIIHKRLISLLILCCKDQKNAIPQIAKIASFSKIVKVLKDKETPFLLKKKYLRLLLQVHLTSQDEQLNQVFIKELKELRQLFLKVILQDLFNFPQALRMSYFETKDRLEARRDFEIKDELNKQNKNNSTLNRKDLILQNLLELLSIDPKTNSDQLIQYQQQLQASSLATIPFSDNTPAGNIGNLANQTTSSITTAVGKNGQIDLNYGQSVTPQVENPKSTVMLPMTDKQKEEFDKLSQIDSRIQQLENDNQQRWGIILKKRIDKEEKKGPGDDSKDIQNNSSRYLNQKDPKEYFKYLTGYSNNLSGHDGLLHFLKDFFQNLNAKAEMDHELIDAFKELIKPLNIMNETIKFVAQRMPDMISNSDDLTLRIDEAIREIRSTLSDYDKMQKENEQVAKTQKLSKKSVRYDGNQTKSSYYNDRTIDGAFDRSIHDLGIRGIDYHPSKYHDNQGLLSENDNKALQGLHIDYDDNKGWNNDDQEDDLDKVNKYLKVLCDFIKKQGKEFKGLMHLYSGGAKIEYRTSDIVTTIQFNQVSKRIFKETGQAVEYKDAHIIEAIQQNAQSSDDIEKADEGVQNQDTDQVGLGTLNEMLVKFVDSEFSFNFEAKKALKEAFALGYIDSQKQNQVYRKNFKEFVKIIFKSSHLKIKTDLNNIISVITSTFDAQQPEEEYNYLMNFMQNMIEGLKVPNQRFYILNVLKGILKKYQKDSVKVDGKSIDQMVKSIKKYQIILNITKVCDLSHYLIRLLDNQENESAIQQAENEKVTILSVKILNILLEGLSIKIQQQIFEFIKSKQDELKVAEYIKNKIEVYTPIIIQQKYDLIQEESLATLKLQSKNYNNDPIALQEISKIKIAEAQKKRQKTIAKLQSILKLIQLLCDNCHKGFQNYFRDQLTIQQNTYQQSQYQNQIIEDSNENTSSFNVVVIVAKSFMKITDTFRELIYFDEIQENEDEQAAKAENKAAEKPVEDEEEDDDPVKLDEIINGIEPQWQKNKEVQVKVQPKKNYTQKLIKRQEIAKKKHDLSGLMQSYMEVIIDFLYGPCEENQLLLSGWEMFLINLNFYFKSKHVYFFSYEYSNECRYDLMFKASLLLLGIVETPNTQVSKKILMNLKQGISFKNLQQIMIKIHQHKIFQIEGSYQIFKSRRRLLTPTTSKNNYPNQSLRPSDETIFEIGFNVFKFLYIAKRLYPRKDYLRVSDAQYKPSEEAQLERDYRLTIETEEKQKTDFLLKDQSLKTQMLLRFVKTYISYLDGQNSQRIKEQHKSMIATLKHIKKIDKDRQMVEREMIQRSQALQEEAEMSMQGASKKPKSIMKTKTSQKSIGLSGDSKLYSQSQELYKTIQEDIDGKDDKKDNKSELANMKQIREIIKKIDEQDSEKKQLDKSEYEKQVQKMLKEFDDTQEDEKSDAYQHKQQESLILTKACQFYQEFIAEVEINYRGTLVRSIFKIPQKCAFLSSKSRKHILYGHESTSLFDKLEAIFSHMPVTIQEMKSNQRLCRKSAIRYWISEYNVIFQTLSTIFILLVNLVYLIFYERDEDGHEFFRFDQMAYVAWILAVAQAIISFFIHMGYIDKYHGAYYERYQQERNVKTSRQYTKFKGSLGFAEGTQVIKEARNIVESSMHNLREEFNRAERKEKQALTQFKSYRYAVMIYFIGLKQDPIHAFNLLYLVFSIGAIFYPFLFSVLLLENILQIPLLFNVIQAIVNNRRQILLTLVLLLAIVYLYSFIAFKAFASTYVSADQDGTETPFNTYCQKLGFCFTSTLNTGVRSGGGIGDTLAQLSIDDDLYWGRYVFDLTFYIMIIVLLLNLIFGIIIDAFAAMRDMRVEVEKEVMEKCFICGNPSNSFESKKKSFQDHIQKEHNLYAYIYYIFYLSRKPPTECTGVERYVQQKIRFEDPIFFPINRAIALEEVQEEENNDPDNPDENAQKD